MDDFHYEPDYTDVIPTDWFSTPGNANENIPVTIIQWFSTPENDAGQAKIGDVTSNEGFLTPEQAAGKKEQRDGTVNQGLETTQNAAEKTDVTFTEAFSTPEATIGFTRQYTLSASSAELQPSPITVPLVPDFGHNPENIVPQYITDDEDFIELTEPYTPTDQPDPDLAPALPYNVIPSNIPAMYTPYVGQEFESNTDAYNFYLKYAKDSGFGVVKRNSRQSCGQTTFILFTCQKGSRQKRIDPLANPLKRKPRIHTNCPARLVANFNKKKLRFIVSQFEPNHNHMLFLNHSRFIRSHQQIPFAVQKQFEINDQAGIPIHKSVDAAHAQSGGPQNCMFTEINARRFVDKVRRLRLGEGDAQALMEYFDRMQRETPDFFYSCNLDKEGRLINVFWADGRSRAAFKEFGQVISFDTT